MSKILINPDFFPDDHAHFMLNGPVGLIEVMTTTPKQDAHIGIGVVCHPHPLQEGAMTNKVVHTTAKAFERKGLKTVRFNFRGVGQSQGSFADAVGETDDLMAVLHWIDRVVNPKNLYLAGFSFGAYVAANGAAKSKVHQLITIAPGIKNYPFDQLQNIMAHWLMIQGDLDDIVDVNDVQHWVDAQSRDIDFHRLADAGHFFHGKLIDLRTIIEDNMIEPK
jgi:uncharacterized protein